MAMLRIEGGAVDPQPMEDDGELAGRRGSGFTGADPPGEGAGPALEAGRGAHAMKPRHGGPEDQAADQGVAALADPAGSVALARLIASRRHADMWPPLRHRHSLVSAQTAPIRATPAAPPL